MIVKDLKIEEIGRGAREWKLKNSQWIHWPEQLKKEITGQVEQGATVKDLSLATGIYSAVIRRWYR